MPLELILIRHGETDWNKDGVFRGHMDMRMNATGIAQADATAEALKGVVFDAIYSSPLKRAMVTARRVAKPHEIEVRAAEGLTDIFFGSWQGLTEAQVEAKHPKLLRKWKENPAGVRPPGGESVKKAWKRVNSQLRELLFMHGTGTVVIVSHRVPLKMMTAYLMKRKLREIREIKHDPCAISVFRVHGKGEYEAVKLNDSDHLRGLNLPKPDDF
jgi:broad specificity phosphatase PhoE